MFIRNKSSSKNIVFVNLKTSLYIINICNGKINKNIGMERRKWLDRTEFSKRSDRLKIKIYSITLEPKFVCSMLRWKTNLEVKDLKLRMSKNAMERTMFRIISCFIGHSCTDFCFAGILFLFCKTAPYLSSQNDVVLNFQGRF